MCIRIPKALLKFVFVIIDLAVNITQNILISIYEIEEAACT